jgi:protein-L-isoaspartate(D-aspartate) O-methyltransferase
MWVLYQPHTSINLPLREVGRMTIPAGRQYTQALYLLTKKNGKIRKHAVLPVRFVPMIDEEGEVY